MYQRLQFIAICSILLLGIGCVPASVLVSPVPAQIKSLEGYASLRINAGEGSGRTKFSFIFHLPEQGRIEVSDFLGRSLYQIVITQNQAYLVIPAKKVYWQGEETEIIDTFLSFRLTLDEMRHLITGDWAYAPESQESGEWELERDEQGRVLAGQRQELRFSVEEFIGDTHFPRSLSFEHPVNSGRLKILRMDFNKGSHPGAFSTAFREKYSRKTWEEIREILNNES